MTNKEIIIDGVDVSKCPDLMKEYLPSCYCSTLDKENQEASCAGCFCLFKIKQYMNNNKLIEDLKYELKCRTAECEELKDRIKKLRKNLALEIEENDHYRKALDEIKEICCDKTKNCKTGCFLCTTNCNENKILDIISKVKRK